MPATARTATTASIERNRSMSSLRYGFLQLPLGAMHRTDRNARLSRDRAHAQASRKQWRNFGPSGTLGLACFGCCESGRVGRPRVPERRIQASRLAVI